MEIYSTPILPRNFYLFALNSSMISKLPLFKKYFIHFRQFQVHIYRTIFTLSWIIDSFLNSLTDNKLSIVKRYSKNRTFIFHLFKTSLHIKFYIPSEYIFKFSNRWFNTFVSFSELCITDSWVWLKTKSKNCQYRWVRPSKRAPEKNISTSTN